MGAIESRIAPDKTEKPAKHQRIVDNGVCVPAEFSRSRSVGDIDFPTELRLAPINMRLKWICQNGALKGAALDGANIQKTLRFANEQWIKQLPKFESAVRFRRLARKRHWIAWVLTRLAYISGAPARRAAALGDSNTLAKLLSGHQQSQSMDVNDQSPVSPLGNGMRANSRDNGFKGGCCTRRGARGRTPLWYASYNGQKACLSMLLAILPIEAIEEPDDDDVTPIDAAYISGNRPILLQIIAEYRRAVSQKPRSVVALLRNAMIHSDAHRMEQLLILLPDSSAAYLHACGGRPLLAHAIFSDCPIAIIQLLLSSGPVAQAINATTSCGVGTASTTEASHLKSGDTALHVAIRKKRLPAVRLLLLNGADIHARNGMRCAPIMLACMIADPGIATFLMARGSDLATTNASRSSDGSRDGGEGIGAIHAFLENAKLAREPLTSKDERFRSMLRFGALLIARVDRAYNLQSSRTTLASPTPGKKGSESGRKTRPSTVMARNSASSPADIASGVGNDKGDLFQLRARIEGNKDLSKKLANDTVEHLRQSTEELKQQAMATTNRQLQLSVRRAEAALSSITARELYSAVDGYPHQSLKLIGMALTVLMGFGNGEELALWDEFKFLVGNGEFGAFYTTLKHFDGGSLTEDRVQKAEGYMINIDDNASYRSANVAKGLLEWMRARIEYFNLKKNINAEAFESALHVAGMLIDEGEDQITVSMKRLKKTAKPLKQHDRNRAIEGGRAISKSLGYMALVKACTASASMRTALYADPKDQSGGEGNGGGNEAGRGSKARGKRIMPAIGDGKRKTSIGMRGWAKVKKTTGLKGDTLKWVELRNRHKDIKKKFKHDVVASVMSLARCACDTAINEALDGLEACTPSYPDLEDLDEEERSVVDKEAYREAGEPPVVPRCRHVLPEGNEDPEVFFSKLITALEAHAEWMLASAHLSSAERKAEGAIKSLDRSRESLLEAKTQLAILNPC